MKKHKKLNYKERTQLEMMHNRGISIRLVASKLKRAPSTVSREIKRNSSGSCYVAHLASHASRARLSIARAVPRKMSKGLKKKLKAS